MELRENIDPKFKWDLSGYIKDDKMLEEEFKFLEESYPKFKTFENKLTNKEDLLKYYEFNKEFIIRAQRWSCFVSLNLNTDSSNTKYIELSQKLGFLNKNMVEELAKLESQFDKLPNKYLKELMLDDRFKEHRREFETLIKNKKHLLDDKTNLLLERMSLFTGACEEAYNELTMGEIQFNEIEYKGEKYLIDNPTYAKFMNGKDRELRSLAQNAFFNAYEKNNKTISSLYINQCLQDNFYAKLKKFKNRKEMDFFYDEVPERVFDVLIENLEKAKPILHDCIEERQKFLGYEKMFIYDLNFNLLEDKEYCIQEAQNLIKEATAVLGEEYQNLLKEKFNQNVIDYLPNKNKYDGAFSAGSYGCPSVVLTNFIGDYNSVSTLAHEIGHAIHTELSDKYQPFWTSGYSLFVAEVASTVNELLLLNLMINKSEDKDKKALLFKLFAEMYHSSFEVAGLAKLEFWVHENLDNDIPTTYEDINNFCINSYKDIFGDTVEVPDYIKYKWSFYSHYYTPAYLYKYATAFIASVCIVEKLLTEKDFSKKYLEFLKSGSSKKPVDLLKDMGVNLMTNKPYDTAFKYFKKQLDKVRTIKD